MLDLLLNSTHGFPAQPNINWWIKLTYISSHHIDHSSSVKVILVMFVLVHIGAVVLAFGALVPSVSAGGSFECWRLPLAAILGPRTSEQWRPGLDSARCPQQLSLMQVSKKTHSNLVLSNFTRLYGSPGHLKAFLPTKQFWMVLVELCGGSMVASSSLTCWAHSPFDSCLLVIGLNLLEPLDLKPTIRDSDRSYRTYLSKNSNLGWLC